MICENCGQTIETKQKYQFIELKSKHTFLGFQKIICPKCNYKHIYPLGKGYKVLYTVVLVIGLIILVVGIFAGYVFSPSILFIAAIIALYKDSQIRK
jgi:hypothetical protein